MSDRYGSYRRDRFGFRTGAGCGPARRSIRVLFVFNLYERLRRSATTIAETVRHSRSARPCSPFIRFDGNRRSTVRPVVLPVRFGRTVAQAFRPSLPFRGSAFSDGFPSVVHIFLDLGRRDRRTVAASSRLPKEVISMSSSIRMPPKSRYSRTLAKSIKPLPNPSRSHFSISAGMK